MKQFNYKKAWEQLSVPGYDSLPHNVRDLVMRVERLSGVLQQGQDLDVVWPTEDMEFVAAVGVPIAFEDVIGLREAFEKIPTEWLAQAARVVHDYGHWFPSDRPNVLTTYESVPRERHIKGGVSLQRHGAYWKFSNLADQVLCKKLGIKRERVSKLGSHKYQTLGITFEVHQGGLRSCYASPWEWTWKEIGWAIQSVYAEASKRELPARTGIRNRDSDAAEAFIKGLVETCDSESFKRCTDINSFMEDS